MFGEIISPKNITRVLVGREITVDFKINYSPLLANNVGITIQYSDNKSFSTSEGGVVKELPFRTLSKIVNSDMTIEIDNNTNLETVTVQGLYRGKITIPDEAGDGNLFLRLKMSGDSDVVYSRKMTYTKSAVLEFTLQKPIDTDKILHRVKVGLDMKNFDPTNYDLMIEATNNANDVSPVWEEITESFTDERFGFIANNRCVNKPALDLKVTILSNNHVHGTGLILSNIYLSYY